jgi:hypothetical protein
MDAVGQKLLDVAKGQLGYSEKSSGYTKFGDWFAAHVDESHDSYFKTAPWCDMFLAWAADQAGVQAWTGEFAGTVDHAKWFQQQKAWGTTPEPGAIVFFSWSGDHSTDAIDHVGLVESVSGSTLHTIEGNTDGGVLERRTRDVSDVVGYGYPAKVVTGLPLPGTANTTTYVGRHAAPGGNADSKILTESPSLQSSSARTAASAHHGVDLPSGQATLTGAVALLVCGTLALAVTKSTVAKVPAALETLSTPPAPRLRKRGKHHRTATPVALPADLTPAEFEMVSDEAEMSTVMMPAISAEVAQHAEDQVFWGKISEIKDDEELAFWDDLHSAVAGTALGEPARDWFQPTGR